MALAILWYFLSFGASLMAFIPISQLIFDRTSRKHPTLSVVISDAVWTTHLVVQTYVYMAFQQRPRQQVGPFIRSAIQVTSVLAAVILGLYWLGASRVDDLMFIVALVMVTVDLLAFAQLMHVAADISLVDVLLGALMQVVMAYLSSRDNIGACVAGFISCCGVIFYRYRFYSEGVINCDLKSSAEFASG